MWKIQHLDIRTHSSIHLESLQSNWKCLTLNRTNLELWFLHLHNYAQNFASWKEICNLCELWKFRMDFYNSNVVLWLTKNLNTQFYKLWHDSTAIPRIRNESLEQKITLRVLVSYVANVCVSNYSNRTQENFCYKTNSATWDKWTKTKK